MPPFAHLQPRAWLSGLLILSIGLAGCARNQDQVKFNHDAFQHYQRVATRVEYPDQHCTPPPPDTGPPVTINAQPLAFWDLPLEQAVQLCLQNSRVMRDLGGFVLRSPATTRSIHTPAIAELDPRFGVEAALSEFDATFAARTSWEKNDRALNNLLLGGGTNFFKQDLGIAQAQLQKRAASGTLFTARHNIDYDANSAPANIFGSAWNANFEAEVRQPLLQNAGSLFNRTAGPNSTPGYYTGVLLARTNTDTAIADFELGVRDLVSNVENAYWDLYFAYRDLDAKIAARDAALESWRRVQALNQTGRKGGEAEREAEAREQYFRFEEEAQNALTGRLVDGTQTNNGSSGGTFRATSGVHLAERRLRLIIGLPISDGRLIRPADQPKMSKVVFDWDQALQESLVRRAELRKQSWIIKRRELELVAARNFLLPNLDATGRYRWRGFGKNLLDPNSVGVGPFDNAYDNLFGGDFQEWQLGMELNMPLGFRRGYAALRHAQLQLARDRAILHEQERDVQLGLSNAIAEVERAYMVAQTNYNRRVAAKEQLVAVEVAFEADKAPLDLLLDAQRRAAESESRFHGSLVDYSLAIKNVHFEKGTLLDHNEIFLAEGPWPTEALADAVRRDGKGKPPWPLNYVMRRGPAINDGPVPQDTEPHLLAATQPAGTEPPKAQPPATSGESVPPGKAAPPQPPANTAAPVRRVEPIPAPPTSPRVAAPAAVNPHIKTAKSVPAETQLIPSPAPLTHSPAQPGQFGNRTNVPAAPLGAATPNSMLNLPPPPAPVILRTTYAPLPNEPAERLPPVR
ncbi:MAG: TolC family protein [Pirellulales bacterium]|nr:TolC family protein [Pirellulales bacterium]